MNIERGVFVEAGANDGVTQSNTLFLERAGWTGLLIEPTPTLADKCRKSRSAPVEQCALVPPNSPPTVTLTYSNLMTVTHGAMGSEEGDAAHAQTGEKFLERGEKTFDFEAPAMTLTQAFKKHDLSKIDLMCLDIEGYEAPVLSGLDFDQYQPTWLLIEVRFEDQILAILGDRYVEVDRAGKWDVLYRSKAA